MIVTLSNITEGGGSGSLFDKFPLLENKLALIGYFLVVTAPEGACMAYWPSVLQ